MHLKLQTSEDTLNLLHEHLSRLIQSMRKQHVYFDESGSNRLCSILGYIAGIRHGGNVDFADCLSHQLTNALSCLTPNGNKTTVELVLKQGDSQITVPAEVPMKKVLLSDDGTFHGFSMRVYCPVSPAVFNEELLRQESIAETEFTERKNKHAEDMREKVSDGVSRIVTSLESKWEGSGRENDRKLMTAAIKKELNALNSELCRNPQPVDWIYPIALNATCRRLAVPEPHHWEKDPVMGDILRSEVYNFITDEQVAQRPVLAHFRRICSAVFYAYRYNGGVIYHGPNAGQNFTVTLDHTRLWGIHT